jgi:hypothetical protein
MDILTLTFLENTVGISFQGISRDKSYRVTLRLGVHKPIEDDIYTKYGHEPDYIAEVVFSIGALIGFLGGVINLLPYADLKSNEEVLKRLADSIIEMFPKKKELTLRDTDY